MPTSLPPPDLTAIECLRALARELDPSADPELTDALPPGVERALEITGDAVVVIDAARRIVYANRRAVELTGKEAHEIVGRTCVEGLRCQTCLETCALFETGEFCDRHIELETRDGRIIHVVKSGRLLHDPLGRIVGGVETMQDVTDLRIEHRACQVEADHLAAERNLLKAFAENAEAGIAIVDAAGTLRSLSACAARLLRVDADRAPGTPLRELLAGGDPGLNDALREVLDRGSRRDVLGVIATRAPRSDAPLLARITPLVTDSGGVIGAAVVLRTEHGAGVSHFHGLIGVSHGMRHLYCQIRSLASSDATVLVMGETGTGKEMVARALHEAGDRAARPFQGVNCAALAQELVESELFGHERGSFTGAVREKPGRLELVRDGTLLLDEVGCLPLPTQAKLLRVLEAREFERVGGTHTIKMNARLVSATNVDLLSLVRAGQFREDLYYRLRVVPLVVPPLRERREDIPLLALHFARSIANGAPEERDPISAAAMAALQSHAWPGNVRELRSAIQYALAVGGAGPIDLFDLPPDIRESSQAAKEEPERTRIERALHEAHFNRAEAADVLGCSRTTLWRKMRRHGLA